MLVCISLYDVSFLYSQCLIFLVEFFLLLCGRCWHAWVKFLCILWKFTFVTFVKNFLYGNENFSLYFTCVHSFVTCPLLWLKYHIKYTKNWKILEQFEKLFSFLLYWYFFLFFVSLNYQHWTYIFLSIASIVLNLQEKFIPLNMNYLQMLDIFHFVSCHEI